MAGVSNPLEWSLTNVPFFDKVMSTYTWTVLAISLSVAILAVGLRQNRPTRSSKPLSSKKMPSGDVRVSKILIHPIKVSDLFTSSKASVFEPCNRAAEAYPFQVPSSRLKVLRCGIISSLLGVGQPII